MTRRRARGYYSLLASVLALFGLLAGGRADSQVGLTITPAMTRGVPTAPVTLVEFTDYQ